DVVAAASDAVVPPRVVARERVPEQVRRPPHRELLALIVGKDDVGKKREERREETKPDGRHRDPDDRTGLRGDYSMRCLASNVGGRCGLDGQCATIDRPSRTRQHSRPQRWIMRDRTAMSGA